MPRSPKPEEAPVEVPAVEEAPVDVSVPPIVEVPKPKTPPVPERAIFVTEFVRIRHLGVLGGAFVAECRLASKVPERKPLSEWDSLYDSWSRKPRG